MFSRKYCTEVTNLSTLSVFEVEIWCYRGGGSVPKWILRNAGSSVAVSPLRHRVNGITICRQFLDAVLRTRGSLPTGGKCTVEARQEWEDVLDYRLQHRDPLWSN